MQARGSARYLLLTAMLVVLLGTLATLQYRWLGDVSAAERERLRAIVRTRAADFTSDFDRAVSSLYAAFRIDGGELDRGAAAALVAAWNRAVTSSPAAPSLVARVFLFDGSRSQPDDLRALDIERGTLEPAPWPDALQSWRHFTSLMPPMPAPAGKPLPVFFASRLDARAPALVIGIPHTTPVDPRQRPGASWNPRALVRAAIVPLDKEALKTQLVEPLVAKHFGSGATAEYLVTVVRRDKPSEVVYAPPSEPHVDETTADVTMPFFALRGDDGVKTDLRSIGVPAKERVAITILRRVDGAEPVRMITRDEGAWELLIRCRAGSLDAVVARSRQRNAAIGLGVLALLGASFVLVVVSAQRQQRLARQQMEFVASISHELRTPLAVICSAAENLADGVVADHEQVKQYGALVQAEGRRLADMVERVMEFAGISAGGPRRPHTDVDLGALVSQATAAAGLEARRRRIDVRVEADGRVPPVPGDPEGLRSALQNIIGNAVKYSPDGATVDVIVEADDSGVRVRVADQGIGIDADELPHVFEPFFRGRRAIDRQLRGTGVGLSVVKQVVDAHGGAVRIDSRPDAGTVVTMELPAAGDSRPAGAPQVSHAS